MIARLRNRCLQADAENYQIKKWELWELKKCSVQGEGGTLNGTTIFLRKMGLFARVKIYDSLVYCAFKCRYHVNFIKMLDLTIFRSKMGFTRAREIIRNL